MNMKSTIKILALAVCALVASSCSIVKGLRADGKSGPNIFSFEKQEHDTIAIGNEVFRFRTPFSIKTEWATHNALYALGIRREQTKDLDLNYPQKVWERLAYPFVGCIVWLFIK